MSDIIETEKQLRLSVKSNSKFRSQYDKFVIDNGLVNYFTNINTELIVDEIFNSIDKGTFKFNRRYIPSEEVEDSILISDDNTIDRCIRSILDKFEPKISKDKYQKAFNILNKEIYDKIILLSYESKEIIPPIVKLDNNEEFNTNWIDDHSILPRLEIKDILSNPMRNINSTNKKIVYEAPTGSGKTLRLAQMIAEDSTHYGIILTHSYKAGRDLYGKILSLNPTLKNDVLLLFHKSDMYKDYIKNPALMDTKRWIIMYKDRIYQGDLNQFLIWDKDSSGEIYNPIIISDETIVGKSTYDFDINILSFLINKFGIKIDTCDIDCMLVAILKEKDRIVQEIKELRGIVSEYYKSATLKSCMPVAVNDLFLIYRELDKSYSNKNIRSFDRYNSIIALLKVDKFIDDLFNNTDELAKILKDQEIQDEQLNMSRVRDLIGVSSKISYNPLMTTNKDVIVFDASGSLNYSNTDFTIVRNNYYKSGLVKFNILPYQFNINDKLRSNILKDNKKLIEDDKVLTSIQDNSLVVGQMNYKCKIEDSDGDEEEDSFEEMLRSSIDSSKNISIDHYYGANLVGSNELRSMTNIYFMNIPRLHNDVISQYNMMGEPDDERKANILSGFLLQAIGRTKYRDLIVKYYRNPELQVCNEDVINVYFSRDYLDTEIGKIILGLLSNKLNATTDIELEVRLKCLDIKTPTGKSISDSVVTKLLDLINNKSSNKIIRFNSKYEFKTFIGTGDNKVSDSYIDYLDKLGYNLIIKTI